MVAVGTWLEFQALLGAVPRVVAVDQSASLAAREEVRDHELGDDRAPRPVDDVPIGIAQVEGPLRGGHLAIDDYGLRVPRVVESPSLARDPAGEVHAQFVVGDVALVEVDRTLDVRRHGDPVAPQDHVRLGEADPDPEG